MVTITTRAISKMMPIAARIPVAFTGLAWLALEGVAIGCAVAVGGAIVAVGMLMGVAVGCEVAVDAGVVGDAEVVVGDAEVVVGLVVVGVVGVAMLVAVAGCSRNGGMKPASLCPARAAIATMSVLGGRSGPEAAAIDNCR
jgi:hypothetical protein